jgi:hypothetical protein
MKYGVVIIAVLVGFFLGSWWPRADLRIAKNQIESLKNDLVRKEQSRQTMLANVTRMLGTAASMGRKPSEPVQSKPRVATSSPVIPETDPVPSETSLPDFDNMESLDEVFETASEFWKIRSSQAREALSDSLDLTEEEIHRFDELVDDMNLSLETRIGETVDSIILRGDILPEDGLVLLHDFSGVMLDTYADLDEIFPDDWRSNAPEDAEIFSFINPSVMESFLDLEQIEGAL